MNRNANQIRECHETAAFEMFLVEARHIDPFNTEANGILIDRLEEALDLELLSAGQCQYITSLISERRKGQNLDVYQQLMSRARSIPAQLSAFMKMLEDTNAACATKHITEEMRRRILCVLFNVPCPQDE